MKIIVDAMGAERGPGIVVEGAVDAIRDFGVAVVLVGQVELIRPIAVDFAGGEAALSKLALTFVEASEVVTMEDKPMESLKRKRDSSISVGLRLLRDGGGDAFLSPGNTGAVMAAATVLLRRMKGVGRAALAAVLPHREGMTILLDVGADHTAKPQHLEHFAVMGSCLARSLTGVEQPKVALLSQGEEDAKGNSLVQRVHRDLRASSVNFVGNIDGKGLFSGDVDVIVTDGFTGNAVLKSCESLVMALATDVRARAERSIRLKIGLLLLRPLLKGLARRVDHSEYGAVPLLGVRMPVFIGHGSSTARGITSGIRGAMTFVEGRVIEAIERELGSLSVSEDDAAPGNRSALRAQNTARAGIAEQA